MRRAIAAIVSLLLAVLTGCAPADRVALQPPASTPPPPPGASPTPAPTLTGPTGQPPTDEPRYGCGAGSAPAAVWDTPGTAQDDADEPAALLRAHLDGETDNAGYDVASLPRDGWRVIERTDDRVGYAVEDPLTDGSYLDILVERSGEGWQVVAWGACRPTRVLEGRSIADWHLSETATVGAETTSFTAMVTEIGCTSGADPTDRLGPPEVVVDESTVTITLSAEAPEGDSFACPGIPAVPVHVDLPEPLGDRVLRDGSSHPPGDPTQPRH